MAGQRRSVVPLLIAATLGLILIVAVRQLLGGGGGGEETANPDVPVTQVGPSAPPGCTTVSVVASSEKAALLGTLAERYNASSPTVGDQCVWMQVST